MTHVETLYEERDGAGQKGEMRASKDTTMVHVGSLIVDELSYVIILKR